ncbi:MULTISPECIES: HNH endonuclease signature motif containing protein [unclassified Streptomyces]|uniref:HNH endonuclease signature motif containing protein n=1 Tax=unclassified Streptomyces TaxID=2593676 RepID=UPI002E2C1795|nr:HNH endonuclease [Streptomyces sp. NBC_00223]
MAGTRYTRDLLSQTAAEATSLVEMLRCLESPIGSGPLNYLRRRLAHHAIDTSHFVAEPLPPRRRQTYTKEQLQAAAAHAHSIRGVLEYLGRHPGDSSYSYVRKKLHQFGIDTTHFTSGRGYGPLIVPRETLAAAVAASTSLAGALRVLRMSDNAAARTRVKHSLETHGITTAHFTGQRHFRGSVSPHRKSAEEVLRRQDPGSNRVRIPMLRRALDELGVAHVCTACGTGDNWQGKQLVLEIDHISGDRLDNRRENLRYLCPSCHSQTSTFSNRSRRTATTEARL